MALTTFLTQLKVRIEAKLVTAGITGYTVTRGEMPNSPDKCITIQRFGGQAPELGLGLPGLRYENPMLQVAVRGATTDYEGPMDVINTIYRDLITIQDELLPGTGLSQTRYLMVRATMQPNLKARDGNQRCVWMCNFAVKLQHETPDAPPPVTILSPTVYYAFEGATPTADTGTDGTQTLIVHPASAGGLPSQTQLTGKRGHAVSSNKPENTAPYLSSENAATWDSPISWNTSGNFALSAWIYPKSYNSEWMTWYWSNPGVSSPFQVFDSSYGISLYARHGGSAQPYDWYWFMLSKTSRSKTWIQHNLPGRFSDKWIHLFAAADGVVPRLWIDGVESTVPPVGSITDIAPADGTAYCPGRGWYGANTGEKIDEFAFFEDTSGEDLGQLATDLYNNDTGRFWTGSTWVEG
jgi:hypothetical protein